ncbi:MAG: hypothetical protein H7644_03750 [Candidatus Heimdallarchaeota archaeon]|nr:hypothetical protein [Candidatus Heimdallarchaeota archaeon]MCK5142856.1 hypothetical protein [Candidatus Heimdallarchaeota archaeon]
MSEMDEMIKMLADAPEEQRHQMLTQRLKMVAGQPEEQRIKSIAGLITAVSSLKEKKMKPFIATRMKVFMGLTPEEKEAILVGRMKAGNLLSDKIYKIDQKTTLEVAKQMGEEKFKMITGLMKQIAEKHGLPVPEFAM